MVTVISPFRPPAPCLAGVAFLLLLAGCASDDLLLPRDGAPAELRPVSGNGQSAPAGDPVDEPLVVEARDGAGRPVSGAVVIFQFVDPPAGAEIVPANTETDAAGRASAEVKLGTPAGDQIVEARLDDPDRELKTQFQLTALQPPGGGDGGDGGGGDGGDGGGGDGGGRGNGDGDHGGGGGGGDRDDDDDDDDD